MGHNPNLILLGATQSSVKEVTCEKGDPTTFKAGLAVRKAASGGLQLNDDATAVLIGVSLGEDLSGAKGHTAVCRTGNWVPIRLKNDAADVKLGDITYKSKKFGAEGNSTSIVLVNNQGTNIAVVSVVGNAVTVGIKAAGTTTATVKAAIEAHAAANALISATIDPGDEAAVVAAQSVTSLSGGSDVAVPGQPVLIDDNTGEASVDGDSTAALYLSGVLTGMYPDGTTVPAAWIAMPGGF